MKGEIGGKRAREGRDKRERERDTHTHTHTQKGTHFPSTNNSCQPTVIWEIFVVKNLMHEIFSTYILHN